MEHYSTESKATSCSTTTICVLCPRTSWIFRRGLAIVPTNGQPGVIIQAPVGPIAPVLPVNPIVPVNPVIAPIVPPVLREPPAPVNPLAGIQSQGQCAVIIVVDPNNRYQWAHYFSEELCTPMNPPSTDGDVHPNHSTSSSNKTGTIEIHVVHTHLLQTQETNGSLEPLDRILFSIVKY
jgi:hypothetical protein